MKIEKGIILAGGLGSRLYPLTIASNKQLLPIFDKPVIYYPLTTLMLAGIREVLIISNELDLPILKKLFGHGAQWGMRFSYQVQQHPNGLPEAFILGEKFINNDPVAMILGDNFFHGPRLSEAVTIKSQKSIGSNIFVHMVDDPNRYGVIVLNEFGKINEIEEKPQKPKSNLAITGLYYFDGSVSQRSKKLKPSLRGELEIVDLIKTYLTEDSLSFSLLGRGYAWFDAGTPKSLLDAANYVDVIQSRQGIMIASPEEVAWRKGFIDDTTFAKNIDLIPKSKYKEYLTRLL